MTDQRRIVTFFGALFAVTFALRLCHLHILWADEDYHLAAALQILHGKMLYRDFWYDKPPLAAWLYTVIGALPGWPLRFFDALWITATCIAVWRFARDLWSPREAYLAAGLTAFFLSFDFPSAVIPIAPDLFLLLPHIVAVHFAWQRKPFLAGIACGVALLFNTKAVFALAVCGLFCWPALHLLLAGFLIPTAAALGLFAATGALPGYIDQVWRWGFTYAASSSESQPAANALRRVLDWSGFHVALILTAGAWFFSRRDRKVSSSPAARPRLRLYLAAWLALAFLGVALGDRFFPRYFFLLLPPLALISARAISQNKKVALVAAVLLLIPLVRFGPRYVMLAVNPFATWSDIALDQDNQDVAGLVNTRKHPGDTLFVFGYRPAIYVYTRLPAGSYFWDSQQLTGVPADRHLHDSTSLIPQQAALNRMAMAKSQPDFIVDSLSAANPRLGLTTYMELRPWMAAYEVVARTPLSVIYRKRASAPR
jgi:4-amino-4-deoxy-L-arabinose transferase-like glycosyltransferase